MATKAPVRFKSPLHEMAETTATDFWNDSSSVEELTYAIEHGAVGATSNPTIVGEVLHKEMDAWRDRIAALAPNMQVKVPATSTGIEAVEELTALGVNINATVSFTVPQVIEVAEAVERGLRRREEAGGDTSTIRPVATMMVGRLDDWMQAIAARDDLLLTPGAANWAGIACFKRAYPIFVERGYRTRLLAAAYRHRLHWTELIGGDVVLTMPSKWQRMFNASSIEVRPRIEEPVPTELVDELYREIPDFRRAYDPDGMRIAEFDTFGATVRTLRSFTQSYHDLAGAMRDFMLPNPDGR